jgi:hypothetical protein
MLSTLDESVLEGNSHLPDCVLTTGIYRLLPLVARVPFGLATREII